MAATTWAGHNVLQYCTTLDELAQKDMGWDQADGDSHDILHGVMVQEDDRMLCGSAAKSYSHARAQDQANLIT
jgi:hypothetical protein